MECKGLQLNNMMYSENGEVSRGTGTEKAGVGQQEGEGLERWVRTRVPRGGCANPESGP